MEPTPRRLEDLARDWRRQSAPLRRAALRGLLALLDARLPDPLKATDPGATARLRDVVREGLASACRRDLLPACLGWLSPDHWPGGPAAAERARAELAVAVASLPDPELALPVPRPAGPALSWAAAAALGAAAGCVALAPLASLLAGSREAGLLVGGPLGAAAATGLVALLIARPWPRALLAAGAAAGGLAAGARAIYQTARGRSPGGWLWAGLVAGLLWLLLAVARPRATSPPRSECLAALEPQLEALLSHCSDLVLAWCWAHPDRLPRPETPRAEAAPLGGPLARALLGLRLGLVGGEPGGDLVPLVEALLQRVEEDGYEWQEVARGSPFEPSLRGRFDTFGVVREGHPVETLRPALLRRGELVQRGTLRRLAAGEGLP